MWEIGEDLLCSKYQRFTNICTRADVSLLSYWREVENTKKGNESEAFPTLCGLYVHLLNHIVEDTIFSATNLNKKIKNKLGTNTLSGLLHTKIFPNQTKLVLL